MTATERTPILIVGAGGAGLSLSLFLSQQGISSLLVERRSDVSWYPRARNLNFRTLEVFRGLGLEAKVIAAGSKISRVFRRSTLTSTDQQELIDPGSLLQGVAEMSPEPPAWYCPQSRLEPLLLDEARRAGGSVRYGIELVSFAQDQSGVTSVVKERATGRTSELRADYLIAADGARSGIRRTLALPVSGLGELDEHYIFVYFRAPWSELIQGHEADAFLITGTATRSMFLVTDQDRGMFVIMYSGQASVQDYTPARCKELLLIALGAPDMRVEIVETAAWQPIQRVADRFQDGRVFLLGDAAHTMPPKLGLGVNTAIQSAHNLAWKLAAVIRGQAGARLLATYQTERHSVGKLASEQSLVGPAASLLTQGSDDKLLPAEKKLSLFSIIAGFRYLSEAVVSDEPAPSSRYAIEILERPDALAGQPGTRVPHLWVERNGERISTLDLLDGRFVLFVGPEGLAWHSAVPSVAKSMGIELAAYRVGPGAELLDLENAWQVKMGVSTHGALLARPDGIVGWRTSIGAPNPESKLMEVLASLLCRSSAQPSV